MGWAFSNLTKLRALQKCTLQQITKLRIMYHKRSQDCYGNYIHTLRTYIHHRKNYSTQQVLIRLLEVWREKLDKNFIVGAVLMEISKAFECISQDLIVAKFEAYGIEKETSRLIYSYLKRRKHCVKINNTYTDYNEIIYGVLQSSILGPILFDLSINYLFFLSR